MRSIRRINEIADGRPALRHIGALTAFGAIFCALLLPKLLPVGPGRILSNSPGDGAILLWSLGWWPHALAHGHLVPYTYDVFAPGGTNLAWITSIPTAGILLAPLTHALGVFTAYNALAVLAPITAAWATYLLVHRVTRRWAPSFLAGLLFALSPLQTDQLAAGHLNLSLTALVPLAAYLVVRSLEGSISARAFVASLGVVLAAELGLSTELFAMGTLFGALALALVYAWDRARRPALLRCAGFVAAAYAVAAAIASPLLYAAFALPRPAGVLGTDGSATPFSGVESHLRLDAGAVAVAIGVGFPVVAALVWIAWRERRRPVARALATTALVAFACAPGILVVGSTTVPTPWTLLRHLPLLQLVRPQRLTVFAWLIAAVAAGTWIGERAGSWRRWTVGVVALGALLPAIWIGRWVSVIPPAPPQLAALPRGTNVAVVAGGSDPSGRYGELAFPLVWQVASGSTFRLADAYVGSFSPSLPLAVRRFEFGGSLRASERATVRAWMRGTGVGAVLVVEPSGAVLRQDGT